MWIGLIVGIVVSSVFGIVMAVVRGRRVRMGISVVFRIMILFVSAVILYGVIFVRLLYRVSPAVRISWSSVPI
jgi:tetrahydromethanopterin S-methyltransferase subunit C